MNWRNFGVTEFFGAAIPDAVVSAFGLLTYLGDTATIFVGLALLYWFGNRQRGAYLLGLTLGGLALIVVLKGLFAFPRPPVELHAIVEQGYGFPSGHALGSTVFWGLLALTLDVGTSRQRYTTAAFLIVVVSLSRLVIGVHYLGDVLVGVLVGLIYIGVATRVVRGDPDRAFALAGVVAVATVVTNGLSHDATMAVGGALGAWVAWTRATPEIVRRAAAVSVPAAVAALAVLGALVYVVETISVPIAVLFAVAAVVPAGILYMPAVSDRDGEKRLDATG